MVKLSAIPNISVRIKVISSIPLFSQQVTMLSDQVSKVTDLLDQIYSSKALNEFQSLVFGYVQQPSKKEKENGEMIRLKEIPWILRKTTTDTVGSGGKKDTFAILLAEVS